MGALRWTSDGHSSAGALHKCRSRYVRGPGTTEHFHGYECTVTFERKHSSERTNHTYRWEAAAVIKHIVMLKLKEEANGKAKSENAVILKQELESLKQKIHEILLLEVGINVAEDPDAYDLVLSSEFAGKKELETYIKHPEHAKVAELVASVRQIRIVVDYET